MNIILEQLFGTAMGAIAGFVGAGIVTYWKLRNANHRARAAEVLALEVRTKNILDHVVDTTVCDRALLLALHNGGGRLLAGAKKYASAVHEAKKDGMPGILEDFQGYEVDEEYLLLMQQVEAKGIVYISTAAMRECMLKRRYEADGIQSAVVFRVSETPNRYYYASFTTAGDDEAFTGAANYARMESAINALRRLYSAAVRGGYLA